MHTASTTQPQASSTAQHRLLKLIRGLNANCTTVGAGTLAELLALAKVCELESKLQKFEGVAQANLPAAGGAQHATSAADATAITATPTQIAEAFTAWETGYRLDASSYLTADETRALELDDYGQRCGAYFTGLLRAMQGGAA